MSKEHSSSSVNSTSDSSSVSKAVEGHTEVSPSSSSSKWQHFKDSFKPAEAPSYDTSNMTDLEKAAIATSQAPLERSLKSRHLQMIAIGGSIGTGLFVGSGKTLSQGGPAALLIGFSVVGVMLYCTIQSLGELAVMYPVSGSFATYATRFIDPAVGFAVGWGYGLLWLVVLPLELVAAAICLDYWDSPVNPVVWIAVFYVIVVVINMFGVKGYGEAEFVFSLIKVVCVIGFIIFGICICAGASPNGQGYIGGKYWHTPGAFSNGFHGVCTAFVTAAYSFTGTELIGLAAAETHNPRKTLPTAIKQVFWRLIIFYIVSLTIIGLLVPYNDKRLMGAQSMADASASPFVLAIENAGVAGLPSVINAVILVAVLSVGNSAVYGCSRTLAALSAQGFAPKIVAYVDRKGRPLVGIFITCIFGLLGFVVASDKKTQVFDWLATWTGLQLIFVYFVINFSQLRLRRAMKLNGRSLNEIPFKSQVGIYGSIVAIIIATVVLVAQFYVALYPIGGPSLDPALFFQSYLAAPIDLVLFIAYKLVKKTKFVRTRDIDIDAGRRELDLDLLAQEVAEEEERIRSRGWWYRVYKFFA